MKVVFRNHGIDSLGIDFKHRRRRTDTQKLLKGVYQQRVKILIHRHHLVVITGKHFAAGERGCNANAVDFVFLQHRQNVREPRRIGRVRH